MNEDVAKLAAAVETLSNLASVTLEILGEITKAIGDDELSVTVASKLSMFTLMEEWGGEDDTGNQGDDQPNRPEHHQTDG